MNPSSPPALVLRDIHLPGPPSLWPPAPGWWLLAALVLGLLAWGTTWWLRRRRVRRQRQRVLDALARLEAALVGEPSPARLAGIVELLRRLALTRYPRHDVAALHGSAWLRFLDETGGGGRFSDGLGQVLAEGPYRRVLPPDLNVPGLVALLREWVELNTRPIGRSQA